jgi:hypothetical protein
LPYLLLKNAEQIYLTYHHFLIVVILDYLPVADHLSKVTTHADAAGPAHLHGENSDSLSCQEASNPRLHLDEQRKLPH